MENKSEMLDDRTTKQILIGTGTGLLTGFITMKLGVVAVIAMGGGLLAMKLADQAGIISINWEEFDKKLGLATDKDHYIGTTSFVGGLIVGMASAAPSGSGGNQRTSEQ